MINYQIWKENIFNGINTISDIETQKKIWMGKDPNYVSSFVEDISTLMDSYGFKNDFWQDKNIVNFYFDNRFIQELKILKNMILDYLNYWNNEKLTDEEILNDNEWHKIVEQAKKIVALWPKE